MTRSGAPLHRNAVEGVVARACFSQADQGPLPGRVGLEVERFPIRVGTGGGPAGRLPLAAAGLSSASVLGDLLGHGVKQRVERNGLPCFELDAGGFVTFEPGGQLEHVTEAHRSVGAALAEVEAVGALISEAFDDRAVSLASAGIDVWHGPGSLPLQLDCYRYPAMDAYFHARSPQGRVMMRDTCSLQVNLDLGPAASMPRRWLLANLLAPVLTATFANSPGSGRVGRRAHAWQVLDPTRTGFPARLVDGSTDDPVAQVAEAALTADVLLVRTGPASGVAGEPGWTFGDWIQHPHAEHGPATEADLEYHLSTIFHEVRPRGRFEFRGIDAVPHRWRSVPVTLLVGALEDPRASDQLMGVLERRRPELGGLWTRAAAAGVSDPALCALAVEVWSFALEGARRLPDGHVGANELNVAERFLDQFTMRGRCPADALRERLAAGAADALSWAAEPTPERSRRGS